MTDIDPNGKENNKSIIENLSIKIKKILGRGITVMKTYAPPNKKRKSNLVPERFIQRRNEIQKVNSASDLRLKANSDISASTITEDYSKQKTKLAREKQSSTSIKNNKESIDKMYNLNDAQIDNTSSSNTSLTRELGNKVNKVNNEKDRIKDSKVLFSDLLKAYYVSKVEADIAKRDFYKKMINESIREVAKELGIKHLTRQEAIDIARLMVSKNYSSNLNFYQLSEPQIHTDLSHRVKLFNFVASRNDIKSDVLLSKLLVRDKYKYDQTTISGRLQEDVQSVKRYKRASHLAFERG